MELVAWSSDDGWPDNSIRVGGPAGYTIRTIGRVGQRINEAGGVEGVVDDLRSTATLAVSELLLSTIVSEASPDEISQVQLMHDQAAELGDQIFDPSVWSVHAISVDGTKFALWVATRPEGFAAVADLGACLVTMHGDSLPEPLEFSPRPLKSLPFATT
jgi:hypothetical protein